MDEDPVPGGAEREGPRAARVKLSEVAAIELPDGRTLGVTVNDVSASGFRMQCPETLPVGTKVKLVMRRYDPVEAEIRWAEAGEAGAVFLTSSDDQVR